MDSNRAQAYRAAVFLGYVSEQLVPLSGGSTMSDWRTDVAVDLVKAALQIESKRETSLTEREDIAEVAARILILIADIQLSRVGEAAGYYPEGFHEELSRFLRRYAFETLANLLTDALDPDEEISQAAVYTTGVDYSLEEFLTTQALWGDMNTMALLECVQRLVFAESTQWQNHLKTVEELSDAIQANPSLHLSAEEVDGYAWALSGASDLFGYIGWHYEWLFGPTPPPSARDTFVEMPSISQAVHSEAVVGRMGALAAVRDQLFYRSRHLTADPSALTASWLLAQIDPETARARNDEWHDR
ncbi:hypothetical protein [Mycobacterium marseillense]|uniref:hypothetical protein n=1 Tax=Mycobacterium marseillense TaxID=701042 RepID=UPI0011A3C6BD|nr:hypothetical protein [Mycobacterium marseillense]